MTVETMMARALDTLMTIDEKEEIGQMFALICHDVSSGDQSKKT